MMYNNSLHKTCMMYRIVYTKLSYSLLSHCENCTTQQMYYESELYTTVHRIGISSAEQLQGLLFYIRACYSNTNMCYCSVPLSHLVMELQIFFFAVL